MTTRMILAVTAALLCAGCALMTKSAPVKVRYFTAEPAPPLAPGRASPGDALRDDAVAGGVPGAPATELQLRLGRVEAASYLRDRIAFRDQTSEVGYYSTLRWTEPPEAYLRRAMTRALFERQQVRQIVSGPGPALEVDLAAFEEVREPRHVARVTVTWRLRGDRTVRMQRTATVDQPIAPGHDREAAPAIAEAMAEALRQVVDEVVSDVLAELRREAVPTAAPTAATAPTAAIAGP